VLKAAAPGIHAQLDAMIKTGQYSFQHVRMNGYILLVSVFVEVQRLVRAELSLQ
jgi:hypothetical protein